MSGEAGSKRKYVRADQSTWSEIEALWESGDVTLPELEERFGISRRALQSHFSKHRTIKGAKAAQMAAAVKDRILTEALPDVDETIARAKATREAAYKNSVIIEELIMGQLAAAQKDPSQALKAASALKALSLAAAGLERLHQLKWKALGLDKNPTQSDEPTVLVIQDLTEQEIKAMQQRDHDEDEDDERPSAVPQADRKEEDEDDDGILIDTEASEPRLSANPSVLPDGTRLVRGATQ